MIKKTLLALTMAASAIVIPQLAPNSSAASNQVSVWKASGLQQTYNSYWQPPLNSTTTFANGKAYIKIQVTKKPSNKKVQPAVCFWRDGATKNQFETCASTNGVTFTSTGTMYIELGTPNTWWKKNGKYDWSKQASRGRIMIKEPGTSGRLLLGTRCGTACYRGNDLNQHIPITMKSELIFVAKGATLNPPSDWTAGCPKAWSPQCGESGTNPAPAPAPAPPAEESRFNALTPDRIMDTRLGIGVSAGIRQPGSTTNLRVTGVGGIPADATAVVLNVTTAQSIKQGFVQVYPTGDGTPGDSSNLNVPGEGSTRANLVIVPVGAGGQVTLYTIAGGHLIVDVLGYFSASGATAAGRFVGLSSPVRTLDTRDARKVPVANPGDIVNCGDFSTWAAANIWFWTYSRHGDPANLDGDGDGIPCRSLPDSPGSPLQPPNLYKLGAGSTFRLPVLTSAWPDGGVLPPGATAVVINMTAVQASSNGFLQLYASPSGASPGAHSNLNFVPNETAPNLAIVPIGSDGAIKIYAKSGVHVVADIIGYFTGSNSPSSEAGLFVPFAPDRLIDSKLLGGPLPPKTLQTKNVASLAGLKAADVEAMFMNVTLANSIGPGYLQVFPTGKSTPGSSSTVNVSSAGATRPNATITALVDGKVSIYHFAGGRYVLDAAGYFTSGTG